MVFNDCNIKDTRRELEINTSTHNLISVTKDEFPGITSENVGLNWLCKEDRTCPDYFSYHCSIHRYAVCTISDARFEKNGNLGVCQHRQYKH